MRRRPPRPSSSVRGAPVAVALLWVAACAGGEPPPSNEAPAEGTPARSVGSTAQESRASDVDAFWARLAAHCGRAFEGTAVLYPEEDDWLDGPALTMHVRECTDSELKIPFHVGDDRSRTWVLTRTADGLDLRHDHRLEDGSPAENTMYGAPTRAPGTATRQEFLHPPDDEGVVRGWAIEIVGGERFTYGTLRDGAWRHRLDFDLSTEVPVPPAPWGH